MPPPCGYRRPVNAISEGGASDRIRTGDIQDHNLALYQLSYARHDSTAGKCRSRSAVLAQTTRRVKPSAAPDGGQQSGILLFD
jgi:hypothetical protein